MTAVIDPPDFGQYELLAKIGEGRRGPMFVVCSRSEPSSRTLQVLELCAFATGEEEPLRVLTRDVTRAARIRHRNIVGIAELGANSSGHYVVTEYIEGCTLLEIQPRHRAHRSPGLVLAAVIDVLHGLAAAHSLPEDGVVQPLVHGSISPEHLLIGLDGTCRLTGFGNARPRVQTKPSHRSQTAAGYMAPEQLTGGDIAPASDLFAMGVVLWNAMTGKKLFHDSIEHMTMSNVLARRIPRPSTVGLCPPPAFDAVVLKALDREPARRFQSAAEMAAALRDAALESACLAGGTEVGEWIAGVFGSELAARRSAIREIAARGPRAHRELPVLPPLVGVSPPESSALDELSLDELSRAAEVRPPSTMPPAGSEPLPRKRIAIAAIAAFSVVACVLGWRWSQVTTSVGAAIGPAAAPSVEPLPPPRPIELEVTVLDVRGASTSDLQPSAPMTPPLAAPEPALVPSPARNPVRVKRQLRPAPPSRPAEIRAEPPEAKRPEPRPDPPPAPPPLPPKADTAAKPALEANPYIYK